MVAIEGVARLGLFALAAKGVAYAPIADTLSTMHREVLDRIIAGATGYYEYSPMLGWTIRRGGASPPLYRANNEGVRSDHEYADTVTPGVLRIEAFGDSFTHGDDVPNPDAWTARLEHPGFEVLNFGVGAYGLDQALLRYRLEGRRYGPAVVLIGFMAENINRSVSVFRPFYHPESALPLAKPRFSLDHDTLVLIPNPMQHRSDLIELRRSPAVALHRFGVHDYYYRSGEHAGFLDVFGTVRLVKLTERVVRRFSGPFRGPVYNPGSEAFKVTVATMAEFVREVEADGARPLVLLFPEQLAVRHYLRDGTRSYDILREELDREGLPYLDIVEAFKGCSQKDVAALEPAHFSSDGNARVATYLASRLGIRR
jgi:hypothetical protein